LELGFPLSVSPDQDMMGYLVVSVAKGIHVGPAGTAHPSRLLCADLPASAATDREAALALLDEIAAAVAAEGGGASD